MSTGVVGNLSVNINASTAGLTAGLNQAQAAAQQAGQKMQQSLSQATTGKTNTQGLLQLSRAVDDVQYGLRGVINNIEGIVTGFGGSAGIAGAATIAAVAIGALGPKILEAVQGFSHMSQLAKDLEQIAGSGLQGTFSGVAAEAKAMQAAFEASEKALAGMQKQSQQVVFAAGGPGMGAAPVAQTVGSSMEDIMKARAEATQLARDSAKAAFEAQLGKQQTVAGGLAKFDMTSAAVDQIGLNKRLFQAAVDKFGGGEQVFKRLDFMGGGSNLYGGFKEGDTKASSDAIAMLGLADEKVKLLAEDFEKATGSAEELARIENDRTAQASKDLEENMQYLKGVAKRRDTLEDRRENVQDRIGRIMDQRARSEILGVTDVFSRNLNAGSEDPQLKELQGLREDVRKYTEEIKGLG